MKRMVFPLVAAVAMLFVTATAMAEDEPAKPLRGPAGTFVDANGDGINDNAPDHDKDGIVNHLDPDYKPAGLARGRGPGGKFVDENGDGINDLAPDDDKDGIPNGQDSDYVRKAGGRRGAGMGRAAGTGAGPNFVDENGDGVCDLAVDADGDGQPDCAGAAGTAAGKGRMRGRRGGARR